MYFFNIKPYTDQYFTYYYMMSANWVSVKIMVPSECRPTGFLPTARPPTLHIGSSAPLKILRDFKFWYRIEGTQ